MSQQPQLTPKQQELMNFLNQLATTPLTLETLTQGNQLLDAAADEYRQKQKANADEVQNPSADSLSEPNQPIR